MISTICHKLKSEYPRILALVCIFALALLPLITLAFNITAKDVAFLLKDVSFRAAVINSVIYTFIATTITTALALLAAYLLNTSSLKNKSCFFILLTLGMLVPTISIGLGIRIMFGTNGFLDLMFSINTDARGYLGLILGSVITAFPATFLILYNALQYEDKGPYDAASIMGISRWSTFFRLTLPYLKIALVSAFCACFTLIFSDYGVPMEVAGRVKTLPMYLYDQFMSAFQYGRGSIVGCVLLIPAIGSFIFDLLFKDSSVADTRGSLIPADKTFNTWTVVIVSLICLLLFLPQLAFIALTFTKEFPVNLSFTLEHVANIMDNTNGVGLIAYIQNSMFISVATATIGTLFAYMLAYLSVRKAGRLGEIVNLLSLSTIAIPGLVLGIGYIFMFKSTNEFFYGTFLILIVVNIFHFLGSPYLLAKNCLAKINSEYEVIGETLGISKLQIVCKVLVPSSVKTLIEMFSYFFLNSMITISAVAFLCTFSNQPLSILITTYEKNSNYEMQSVISFIILVLNIVFRIGFNGLISYIENSQSQEIKLNVDLSRQQFELLTWLEKQGKGKYSDIELARYLKIKEAEVKQLLTKLDEMDYISYNASGTLGISEKGLKVLEPYRVRKAIILAAGFGQRLAPVTLKTPKPLVEVSGVRILDTLLDALVKKGITNITIVRGYKRDAFDVLLEKYPFLKFADNHDYNVTNNISSLMKVIDRIDRCYICEADLIINNPDVINRYEYSTNYLGFKVDEVDDWCFNVKNGFIAQYKMGGTNCYQAYGISYWNEEDSLKLKADLQKVYAKHGGKENLWEMIPLHHCAKNYQIEIRECQQSDITEIDNFSELVKVDSSYKDYPGHEEYE